MATTPKPEPIEPPYIPIFYETIERSCTLKDGTASLEALRDQMRAGEQLRRTINRIDATVARLTKFGAPLVENKIEDFALPYIRVRLDPGITVTGEPKDRHPDISNNKVPDPDKQWADSRKVLSDDTLDAEYDGLDLDTERLFKLYAGLVANAEYIDALLRRECGIPDDVTAYTLRSTAGVTGYIITVSPPTTTTMSHWHR